MSIPGQQPINIGSPNNPANSDSLYTAFNTIQNNFTQLFTTSSPITTITSGNGIAVSNSTVSAYTITNTGVTSLIAGNNITITAPGGSPASNGALVISATGGGGGNSGGTVTSIGVVSNTITVTNSPITTAGDIGIELPNIANVAGNYTSANLTIDSKGRVTQASNGTGGGSVTSVSVIAGNGVAVSGSPITTAGNITITNTGVTSIVAGTNITIDQSNGAVTINSTGGGSGGGGTVTRVAVTSNTLTVTGSPVVSSGNIDVELPSYLSSSNITSNELNSNSLSVRTTSNANGITLTTAINCSNVLAPTNSYGLIFNQSRGNLSTPVCVSNGDELLNIQSQGYTRFSCYQPAGGIQVTASGNANTGNMYVPFANSVVSSCITIYSTGIPIANTPGVQYDLSLTDTGILKIPGRAVVQVIGNTSTTDTITAIRARGPDIGNVVPIQVGDTFGTIDAYGYTGNGSFQWTSTLRMAAVGSTRFVANALPSTSGFAIPSDYVITTINTSNGCNQLTYTNTGNLSMTGSYLGRCLSVTGNVTANFFIGNGSQLTGLTAGSSITNGSSNVVVAVNANVTISSNGVANVLIVSGTGANISGTANITGNANVGNLGTTGFISATGNVIGANITTVGLVSATGNVTGANLTTAGRISATGNILSGGIISATGNIIVGGFQTTLTQTANTVATVAATIPIVVNGNTFFIMLAA